MGCIHQGFNPDEAYVHQSGAIVGIEAGSWGRLGDGLCGCISMKSAIERWIDPKDNLSYPVKQENYKEQILIHRMNSLTTGSR